MHTPLSDEEHKDMLRRLYKHFPDLCPDKDNPEMAVMMADNILSRKRDRLDQCCVRTDTTPTAATDDEQTMDNLGHELYETQLAVLCLLERLDRKDNIEAAKLRIVRALQVWMFAVFVFLLYAFYKISSLGHGTV